MKKKISVELNFHGSDKIENPSPGSFVGGVVEPEIEKDIAFRILQEVQDENGCYGPNHNDQGLKGNFQINIYGNSKGFTELGKYFLALAELDASLDPDYHEHLDEITSLDGNTKVNLIIRKEGS
jgi:hypothetical protein